MPTYPCTVGEVSPQTDDPIALNTIVAERIELSAAAALANAQVLLSSGWDADAGFTIDVGSTDQRGIVRVQAGTAPVANPFWTMTFGTPYLTQPFPIVMREGQTQPTSSSTTNTMTVTQGGAIAGLSTIVYHYLLI